MRVLRTAVAFGVLAIGLPGIASAIQSATDRAGEAAIEFLGGGQVTEVEVDDEDGAYEVEVTFGDGSQVDVHLDANFNVISTESDDGSEEDPTRASLTTRGRMTTRLR